jgi:hypothetical protein
MKHSIKAMGWMVAFLLLSAGFAEAQSNTLTFDNGACGSIASCSKGTPAPNQFPFNQLQIDGAHFWFYERTTIGGQDLTHMIIRDKGDVSGGAFQMEQFTRGNGFFQETNLSSIGQVTFRQFINVAGHVSDVTMDALNLIARPAGTTIANQLSVMQNITDPLFGLITNRIVLTPRNLTAPASTDFGANTDFVTHVDQTMTGANGFTSTTNFDVGQPITPKQTF